MPLNVNEEGDNVDTNGARIIAWRENKWKPKKGVVRKHTNKQKLAYETTYGQQGSNSLDNVFSMQGLILQKTNKRLIPNIYVSRLCGIIVTAKGIWKVGTKFINKCFLVNAFPTFSEAAAELSFIWFTAGSLQYSKAMELTLFELSRVRIPFKTDVE
jgi:hypothetical protein